MENWQLGLILGAAVVLIILLWGISRQLTEVNETLREIEHHTRGIPPKPMPGPRG